MAGENSNRSPRAVDQFLNVQEMAAMPIYRKRRGDRWYLYEQHSYRDATGRVRTKSKYLGPEVSYEVEPEPSTPLESFAEAAVDLVGVVLGAFNSQPRIVPADEFEERQERAFATAERIATEIDEYQRATFGETGQERADREKAEQFNQADFLADTQGASDQSDSATDANAGTGEPDKL
jgi:hypothetical protein